MYTFFNYAMLVLDLKNLAAYSVIFLAKKKTKKDFFLSGEIHWSTEDYYWISEQFILEIIQFPPASERASVSGKSKRVSGPPPRIASCPSILLRPKPPVFLWGPECNSLHSVHIDPFSICAPFSTKKGEVFQERNIRHCSAGWGGIWCWIWRKHFLQL